MYGALVLLCVFQYSVQKRFICPHFVFDYNDATLSKKFPGIILSF